jgi:hypothetical protein
MILVACIAASALGALIMCLLVLCYGFIQAGEQEPRSAHRQMFVTRLGHAAAGVCFAVTAVLAAVLIARPPTPVIDPHTAERLAALERERDAVRGEMHALAGERQSLRDDLAGLGARVQSLRAEIGTSAQGLRAELGGSVQAMRAELGKTGGTLHDVRSRLERAEIGLKRLADGVAQAQTTARARVPERASAPPPAEPSVPAASVVSTPAPAAAAGSATAAAPAAAPATPAVPPAVITPTSTPARRPASPPRPTSDPEPKLGDKLREDWKTIREGFATIGEQLSSAVRRLRESD